MTLWWLLALFMFVLCEILAGLACARWFRSVTDLKAQEVWPRSLLLQTYPLLIRLLLVSFPCVFLSLVFLWLWPSIAASALPPVLLTVFALVELAGLLLAGVLLVIFASYLWRLVRHWAELRCVYVLPADTERVKLVALKGGILTAAMAYPQQLYRSDEEIELAARARAVQFKRHRFPRQQEIWRFRLSNDFAAYCQLFCGSYQLGYRRFFADCLGAEDQLVSVRGQLPENQELLEDYARRYLAQQNFAGGDS